MNVNKRKIFKKPDFWCQRGQTFLGGLFFLLITLMFGFYFLFHIEVSQRNSHIAAQVRLKGLSQAAKLSYYLNEIAHNNKMILASLGLSGNALSEALVMSAHVAFAQKFWEPGLGKGYDGKNLSNENVRKIKEIHNVFAKRAERGFKLARLYSQRNNEVLKSLDLNVVKSKNLQNLTQGFFNRIFTKASLTTSFCYALMIQDNQDDYYKTTNFFPILKIPSILNHGNALFYGFNPNSCTLSEGTNSSNKVKEIADKSWKEIQEEKAKSKGYQLNANESSEDFEGSGFVSDVVVDFKLLLKKSNDSAGVIFVKPENAEKLFQLLLFESSDRDIIMNDEDSSRFSALQNFLNKIFHFEIPSSQKNLTTYFAVLNRNFLLKEDEVSLRKDSISRWMNSISSSSTSSSHSSAQLSRKFVESFFVEGWAPLMLAQKRGF